MDRCQEITTYVDKFIAHSATPESRSIQDVNKSAVTFKCLWDAHQIIFEVAEFLSAILFSEGHMALAIENPTFFEYWEKPLYEKRKSISSEPRLKIIEKKLKSGTPVGLKICGIGSRLNRL